jgi:hypothetical protein
MNKKRRRRKLVPPLGPPQNLRPAGAHESKKRYNRKRHKAALIRYDEDGFFEPRSACEPLKGGEYSNRIGGQDREPLPR